MVLFNLPLLLGIPNSRGFSVPASDSRGFGIDSDELTGFPESQSRLPPDAKQGNMGAGGDVRRVTHARVAVRRRLRFVKNIGCDGNLSAKFERENVEIQNTYCSAIERVFVVSSRPRKRDSFVRW